MGSTNMKFKAIQRMYSPELADASLCVKFGEAQRYTVFIRLISIPI